MKRRRFLIAAAASALTGQPRRSVFVATKGWERLVSAGTLYRRAYTGCADTGRSGLFTGMYAHAGPVAKEQTLEAMLLAAGHTFRFVEGQLPMEALLPGAIAVCAGEPDGASGGFRDADILIKLAILAPGLPPGVFDRLVSAVDLMPTLLELCGIEPPDGLHGHSLLREPAEYVCIEGKLGQPGEWRAIVRGYDKLLVDRKADATHLFNLKEDSEEMDNLAKHYDKSQQIRRTVDELKALLQLWRRRTNDGRSPSGLKKRGK